jgi:hypothetical protein
MIDLKFYVYVLYRDVAVIDPFYVGKGHGNRINYHDRLLEKGKRVNRHKNNTIRQCLKAHGFVPKQLYADRLTEQEAFYLERYLISLWGRRDKGTGCLTNMTDGGEGTAGCIYSAEQRARNSAARKGKPGHPKSPEERAKLSAALTGKRKSEAHKEKLRQANLGKTQSQETKAKNSASNTGRIRSLETCQKLSEALTGRERSPEHCANISKAKKGKKQAPDVIARQVESRARTMAGRPGPNLGRVFSAEVRARMRAGHLRRKQQQAEMQQNG